MFWKKWFNRVSKEGVCHMCDEVFPDKELYPSKNYFFCKEHKTIFEDNSWLEILDLTATNEDPQNALLVQDYKDNLKKLGINSYIETQYDYEQDQISTHFKLLVATTDYNKARELVR